MTSREQDKSRIVSVRLPDELIRRLDRSLDWSEISGRVKPSRNAALRGLGVAKAEILAK